MRRGDRQKMAVNRRKWNESVPLHVVAPSYRVDAFLRGATTLEAIELAELGPVRGLRLLHLQCHFGLDTLSWAREGAEVTGVDFSADAVRTARRLARETRLPARFVRSNIYDLPGRLQGRFDVVYTAKGAICWLPDLRPWGRMIARYLAPGGRFYLFEDHPFSDLFPNEKEVTRLELKYAYLGGRALRDVSSGTYATDHAMRNRVSYMWVHPISEVLTALLDAGLVVERVREFPFAYWRKFPFLRRRRDGYWYLPEGSGAIPMSWSLIARAPTTGGEPGNPNSTGRSSRSSRGTT